MTTQIQKAYKRISYKLESLFGYDGYKKILIVTRSRTGSNLLVSLLNSHPAITILGEEMEHTEAEGITKAIQKIYGNHPKRIKAMGFKIFYCHPFPYRPELSTNILRTLASLPNLHVIHLQRHNILRTLTSRAIALEQNVWTSREAKTYGPKQKKAVNLNADELIEGFELTTRLASEAELIFQDVPVLNVSYEQLVADKEKEIHRILDFLALRRTSVATDLKKQNPEQLEDLITNYAELKKHFQETKWARFFD